jgi:hypothetical protein
VDVKDDAEEGGSFIHSLFWAGLTKFSTRHVGKVVGVHCTIQRIVIYSLTTALSSPSHVATPLSSYNYT